MMHIIIIFLLFSYNISAMDQNNSKICFFAQLPLETQNLIYSFLANTFSNISAQKEEYEKYHNLCKDGFSHTRSYHNSESGLISAAFNCNKTKIAFLHHWKNGGWPAGHTITIIDIIDQTNIILLQDHEADNKAHLLALSPYATIVAFITKENNTLPPTPCETRLKVIKYKNNTKDTRYYCISPELKEISSISFGTKGTKIKVEGAVIFTPEKKQSPPYQIFSLKTKLIDPLGKHPQPDISQQTTSEPESKLQKYFKKRGICKNLNNHEEQFHDKLSLD